MTDKEMKALITRKLGMTSMIADDGSVSAVTLLSAQDNVVTQIKNAEADGYQALQVGLETTKHAAKPQKGHLKPSGLNAKIMREFKFEGDSEFKVGDKLSADLFDAGDKIHVKSTSKGKGFAGTIKRHNFALGRKTHGGSSYRKPGSIGSMYPQKIFKGKKMAGQMGHEMTTVKNLKVALVNNEEKVIGVYGAIPGPKKSIVIIKGVK
jgi:large subunit ribosomal protein L3